MTGLHDVGTDVPLTPLILEEEEEEEEEEEPEEEPDGNTAPATCPGCGQELTVTITVH